jgi:hypothetical protein
MIVFVGLVMVAWGVGVVIALSRILTGRSNGGSLRVFAVLCGLGGLAVAFGPMIAGYHHGNVADTVFGEHCIRWFGSVWCRS